MSAHLALPDKIASDGIDARPAFDPQRQQYLATVLIDALIAGPVAADVRRVGVTELDLFLPVFTHIYGYAQLGGTVAIASSFRLRPEMAGDPADPKRLLDRLTKETLHELGHTFGLQHCSAPWCVMRYSRSAEEVDLKDAAYCVLCDQRIPRAGLPTPCSPNPD
jgi:archaemetzincin